MPRPQVTLPPWLGLDCELVLGFVTRPGDTIDRSVRPPMKQAITTVVVLVLTAVLSGAASLTYARTEAGPRFEGISGNAVVLLFAEFTVAVVAMLLFAGWCSALTLCARAVGTVRPIYSERYVLVSLLAPVVNILAPIQTLSHIWDVLSPKRAEANGFIATALIAVWWIAVVGTVTVGGLTGIRILFDGKWSSRNPAGLSLLHTFYSIACLATVPVVAGFTWRLAAAIRRAQSEPKGLQALPIERRPNQIMVVTCMLGVGVATLVAAIGQRLDSFLGIVLKSAGAGLIGLAIYFARNFKLTPASIRMARDPRPPVLYLRSFKHEEMAIGGNAALEELLDEVASGRGPVVALGKPDESIGAFAGAGRLYLPQGNWQETAQLLMDAAQIVLIPCLPGEGLRWELNHLYAQGAVEKVIFAWPSAGAPQEREEVWLEFLQGCPPPIAWALGNIGDQREIRFATISVDGEVAAFRAKRADAANYRRQLKTAIATVEGRRNARLLGNDDWPRSLVLAPDAIINWRRLGRVLAVVFVIFLFVMAYGLSRYRT